MKSFIEDIVDKLYNKYGHNISDLCIVFPNKRAGLFFKKHLAKKLKKPAWSPTILSIEEFICQCSGLTIPDRLTLIFELFEIYKSTLFKTSGPGTCQQINPATATATANFFSHNHQSVPYRDEDVFYSIITAYFFIELVNCLSVLVFFGS